MIKLYICHLVLIIGSVEVGPDIDMKFHQEVMEIVSYDTSNTAVSMQLSILNSSLPPTKLVTFISIIFVIFACRSTTKNGDLHTNYFFRSHLTQQIKSITSDKSSSICATYFI